MARRKRPAQVQFDADGTLMASERLLEGDRGDQLALLAAPAQTGEGLTPESAGPLFSGDEEEE